MEEASFVRQMANIAARHDFDYNIVEAFDQPWKAALENTVGAAWGILDEARQPKFLMTGPVLLVARRLRSFAAALSLALMAQILAWLLITTLFHVVAVTFQPWQQLWLLLRIGLPTLLFVALLGRCRDWLAVPALARPGTTARDRWLGRPLMVGAALYAVGWSLLLLLDGVTDPRNLGACLRTADAAGVGAVIVPRDRSAALTPDAARAAAGAAESVALIAVTNLARTMDELRDAGIRLAGADPADGADATAVPTLYQLDLTGPLAWVLGAEGSGLRRLTRERCDVLARIPLAGAVESLNVAVAAGICLFESVRQRAAEAARGVALAATEQSEGGLESRVITRI